MMSLYRCFSLMAVLLLGFALSGHAQTANDNQVRAQRIYEHFETGRGDSIYAALNDDGQRQLSPAVFNDMYRQLEMQFGKLKSAEPWEQEDAQGVTLYCRNLQFERYALRLLLAFDADGRMNTIRLVPAPAPVSVPVVEFDESLMEERDIAVETDGYRLFCQPGLCPFDLLKLGITAGLLPDAQFPFTNGQKTLQENADFLARYYLGEYYEAD